MSYDLWTAFFSLILNILDMDAWGVRANMKQAPCCVPILSLLCFEAGAFFSPFLISYVFMGGVTARRRRDEGGFFVYRIRLGMTEAVDFVRVLKYCKAWEACSSFIAYIVLTSFSSFTAFFSYIRAYLFMRWQRDHSATSQIAGGQ